MAAAEVQVEEQLYVLPENSRWVRLGALISSIVSGESFSCEERPPDFSEISVAKVSAVSWGEYREEESKTCLDSSEINSYIFIDYGDFLIIRANTIELVGAAIMVEQVSKKIMLSDKILHIQFHEDKIISDYALLFLKSSEG